VGFTSCTGLGDQGPALLVNQHQVVTRMDAPRVAELAELVRRRFPPPIGPQSGCGGRPGPPQRRAAGRQPPQGDACAPRWHAGSEATLAELTHPACADAAAQASPPRANGTLCRASTARRGHTRVVVCNADEGEPGTFKDRVLLAARPMPCSKA
jgi:[NiFe] hydrogenase diaphorase moiety large subunit